MKYVPADRWRTVLIAQLALGVALAGVGTLMRDSVNAGGAPVLEEGWRVLILAAGYAAGQVLLAWWYPGPFMALLVGPIVCVAFFGAGAGAFRGHIAQVVFTPIVLWGEALLWKIMICAEAAVLVTLLVSQGVRRVGNPPLGRCPGCDYDLTGVVTDACPECGRDVRIWRADRVGSVGPFNTGRAPDGSAFEFDSPRVKR